MVVYIIDKDSVLHTVHQKNTMQEFYLLSVNHVPSVTAPWNKMEYHLCAFTRNNFGHDVIHCT